MATVKIKYLLRKEGRLYYQRGIPVDLRPHFSGRALAIHNLKTSSLSEAARLCTKYAAADDARFQAIRMGQEPALIPILNYVLSHPKAVVFSQALERYLTEHRRGQDKTFVRDATRAIGAVIKLAGDKPLQGYTRDEARACRDSLMVGHSSGTVRRNLASIVSVFNFGRREFSVSCGNPFERLAIVREGMDAKRRLPFSHDEIIRMADACRSLDDDLRWIVGLLVGTGARLAEIVGLRRDDIGVKAEIPFIDIRPHAALGRRLKTPASQRLVPLVGIGLWAGRRAHGATNDASGWLFSRYAADGNIRAQAASNAINLWLRHLGIDRTIHSARHSMKDALRDAEVPEELAKMIMGHGSRSVADSYGAGFSLARKAEALAKLQREATDMSVCPDMSRSDLGTGT
jgi:integrase